MKHLSTLLLITALVASCKPAAKETFLISGTIKNTTDKEIKLTVGTRVDTLKLNPDGTFSKEIALARASDAMLQGTKLYASLYLVPGKDLSVTSNAQDFNKELAFSGSMSPENTYLLKKTEAESKSQEWLFGYYKSPNTPADFKRVRDSARNADQEYLRNYTGENGKSDPDFVDHQKKAIQFAYYADLNNYPMMSGFYNTDKPVIPEDWYSFMNGVNLDDPSLLDISEASYFISSHVFNEALKMAGVARDKSYNNPAVREATFKYLKENFRNPEFFNRFAFENLKSTIDSDGPAGLETQIEEYMATSTDEANNKLLKEMVDGWATMAPGQPAPVFNLPDIDGKMVSLTDFAGKYVFIDYWATWCGPCRAEIPAYKKLIEDYKGKNIVFISISVDKDKAAWEKMLKEGIPDIADKEKMIQMTWLQLHDAVRYNKIWLVKFIPTFVLIDTQGKIINARAGRPSNPELRKVLDALPGI